MQELITGLQHIGIPVYNLEESIQFYESLSFSCIHTKNIVRDEGNIRVAFVQMKGLTIELYEFEGTYLEEVKARSNGHYDHIALDVTDIDQVYDKIQKGNYHILNSEIQFIPFFEKGVRFFLIQGPNNEKIEFNQIL